ncbi:MAG: hypothetical protein BGO49_16980 [Planctomycetales bacterium 71-10]|nr:MAG: hypothetical protein BGO49_16980 [Planctomycetales bacterium 71-10]
MSTTNEVPARPRRRRRWWPWAVAAVVLIPALLFAAVPWVASSAWAKAKIEAAANRVLAPGGVSFDAVRLSWFRPTAITAPALLDSSGRKLVEAPTGTFSWSLWQILFARPVVGTLTLHKGAVDIGRSTEGDIDLIDTLKPILKDRPDHTIQIRIEDATLKFTQQGVADPFYADHADIAIDLTRFPEPIAWDLKLSRDREGSAAGKLNIAGSLGRVEAGVSPMKNAALAVTADQWPWRIAPTFGELEGLRTSGRLSGSIDLKVVDGALTTSGDATFDGFTAEGPKLSGDVIVQTPLKLGWKAEGRGGVYQIERFAFDAPVASLSASGEFPPAADRSAKLEGRVDLTLANLLRHTLHLQDDVTVEKGAVTLTAEAKARAGNAAAPGQRIEVHAALSDLAAKKGETTIAWDDPTSMTLLLDRSPDSIALERLDVRTPFLTASGKGDLDSGIEVDASFDLAAARAKVRDWVDLGKFDAAGAGTLRARYTRQDGRYQVAGDGGIKGLVLSGLPVLETVRRDEIKAELAVRGEAEASGLPRDWRYASLAARSAEDELKLETTSPADRPTPEGVKALARTVVDLGGAKRLVEAAGSVVAGPDAIDASNLRLAIGRYVGPGGDFIPQDPYVWRGAARYDVKKDELKIARRDAPPEAQEREPAVSIDDVLAGGLRSNGSTWFRVRASGDFDSIRDAYGLDDLPVGGVLAVECDGKQSGDAWDLDGTVQGQKLTLTEKDGSKTDLGMITLSLDSRLAVPERRLDVAALKLDTPFGTADGEGTVAVPEKAATVDMKGMLAPNWDRLTQELAARVEPGASIRGGPHAWSLTGRAPLEEGGLAKSTLNGEVGLQLDLVDVFGMRLEKTTLALRAVDGKPVIDPIDAMLNGGRLQLDPAVETDEEGGRWLTLGQGSSLAGAIVNDEVSHRFLSYVAPVLDQATRVEGKVSFDLVDARFDLDGDARKTKVEGDVQFDEVRFMPGPLVDQLIDVFNLERKAIFVLRDPISVRILGRTIYQEGLILPVGEVAVIGLDGWMDFDKRIDMLATFAAVPPRRDIPVLSTLLRNAQIQVPLTGTLDNPKIDGEKIKQRFQDFGESLLETTLGVGAGIGDIFRRGPGRPRPAPPVRIAPPPPVVEGPARPAPRLEGPAPARDVPPPPRPEADPDAELLLPGFRLPFSRTPEERQLEKEARQQRRTEKRNERRARQGLPPL